MANIVRTKSTRPGDGSAAPGPSRLGALPRPGGAAADAAAAAEFASKKYVWIPDKDSGYLSAWVVREEEDGDVSVCSLSDGQVSLAYLLLGKETWLTRGDGAYRCARWPPMTSAR